MNSELIKNYEEHKNKLKESNYLHVIKALDELINIFYELKRITELEKNVKKL